MIVEQVVIEFFYYNITVEYAYCRMNSERKYYFE